MAYKYRHIRYNLCLQVGGNRRITSFCTILDICRFSQFNFPLQLKRYEECCSLFKELCSHELKYRFSFDQQNYLFMIKAMLGKDMTESVLPINEDCAGPAAVRVL